MSEHGFRQMLDAISAELTQALAGVDEREARRLEEAVLAAGAVFVTGEGRSGLVARGLAMRLMQLGLRAYVVGETVTPAARTEDLFVAISGSGETSVTRTHAVSAKALGMRVAVVTATSESPLAGLSDLRVLIPAESEQYGRSLFEQAALVLLDALTRVLQDRLGLSATDLDARHANLE